MDSKDKCGGSSGSSEEKRNQKRPGGFLLDLKERAVRFFFF